jgi:plastocyanin
MLSLKALISLAALAAVTQAVVHNNNGAKVIRIFAQSNQVFRPNSVQARKGDVLEFHFEGGNHSVVAGEYQHPCSPLPIGSGFFSGFFAVDKGQLQSVRLDKVADHGR